MKTLAFTFSLLLALAGGALADKPKQEDVERELRSVIAAVFEADMDPIMKHTHDRVIAVVGDRETFRTAIEGAFKQVKEAGVKFVSADIGKEIDYFAGDENEFFLVETTIVMKVGDKEMPAEPGHQLGVKKKTDKVWKYIDCSSLTTELVQQWFLDFPKDKKIPKETP